MSKYKNTVLTDRGMSLATRAANGKAKFSITRAASTADDLSGMSESELRLLEVLPNEVQSGIINNVTESGQYQSSVVGTEILFSNQGIKADYNITAVAIYAIEDGTDEEILYGLSLAEEPEYMPDFADTVIFQFALTMYVVVGRAENVTVKVDMTAYASRDYVNEQIKIVNNRIDLLDFTDKLETQELRNNLIGVFG